MDEIIATITWHHLAFVFAIICVFVFRQPIAGLIGRTTKIDRDGLTADPSPESQKEKTDTSSEAVQQLLDVVGNSVVIAESEDAIRRELTTKGLAEGPDAVKVLIRHLAGTQVLLAFERVHSAIFGSQIYLLKKLNEVAGQGRPLSDVAAYYDHVKKQKPEFSNWSLDQYLSFLFSQLLIVRNGDQFHVTNFGVEYLTWLARTGRTEEKAL